MIPFDWVFWRLAWAPWQSDHEVFNGWEWRGPFLGFHFAVRRYSRG